MIRRTAQEQDWIRVERVFEAAGHRAHYHGEVELARTNPLRCYAYSLKRTPAGRMKKTRFWHQERDAAQPEECRA